MGALEVGVLRRKEGWETRLFDTIEIRRTQSFVWGQTDCVCFLLNIDRAITGGRLSITLPDYATAKGALAALKGAGYKTLKQALNAHFKPVSLRLAQRGDIVLRASTSVEASVGALGVVMGAKAVFLAEDEGLTFLPLEQEFQAWRLS